MKAKIYSHKNLIGEADLKVADESMGGLGGVFEPTKNYIEVQKVFQTHQYNQNRFENLEKIRLNVQLENGLFLLPIGGILIGDCEELPNEDLEIDISGVFRFVIEDFFNREQATDEIIEQPWELITIEQKINFEDELRKEIGSKKDLKHPLAKYEFSAVAKSMFNADVLFAMIGDKDNDHVVIHLTWKGSLETTDGFPQTEFYTDFHHFKYYRMYPDRNEYEY